MEVGHGQSCDVQALLAAAVTPAGPPKSDLAGIRRVVTGRFLPR
jgi:release factor glutamine methyltransferase